MKYIITVIVSHKLEDVRDALLEVGIDALTVFEVKRYGSTMGHREIYRAADYTVGFMPHTRIECVVSDEDVDAVVERLRTTAFSNDLGEEGIAILSCDWQIL
jgi:nitrogen regulatory protein PII